MKVFLLTDGEFTGLIRSLRSLNEKVRIIGFCSSLTCAHSAMLDAVYTAPEIDDKKYYDFLIGVIKKEKVNYVFPVATSGLEFMADSAEKIREQTGAVVITSESKAIKISNNKGLLYAFLKNVDGLEKTIEDFRIVSTYGALREGYGYFNRKGIPCIMKPLRGENAEGFLRFTDKKDFTLSALKGGHSHKIALECFEEFPNDEALPSERLVMPFLPGREWDVDVLADNGKIVCATVRINNDMFGGLSASSVTAENPVILGLCEKIVSSIGLSYLSCISFREDENGVPKLLEINPRAMGSIHLSTLAGNSLVEKLLNILDGKSVSPAITRPGFSTALYYDIIETSSGWNILKQEDREIYGRYYSLTKTKMTDLSFGCRFAWDEVYNVRWKIIENCFVQASFNEDNPFMLMPLGEFDIYKLERIILAVKKEFDDKGLPLKILCIEEEYLPVFEKISISHSRPECNDDFSDYLYDGDSLRELKGKKYSKKRNHFSQFMRAYPDYEYISLNDDIFDECIENSLEWSRLKNADTADSGESDHMMIKRVIKNYNDLDYKGGAIRINGKVAAFAIGSQGNGKTCFIHFEKAETEFIGIYAAINKLVLENEFPDAEFVNREEDLGHENLRKAKQSYYPVSMVRKYSIKII